MNIKMNKNIKSNKTNKTLELCVQWICPHPPTHIVSVSAFYSACFIWHLFLSAVDLVPCVFPAPVITWCAPPVVFKPRPCVTCLCFWIWFCLNLSALFTVTGLTFGFILTPGLKNLFYVHSLLREGPLHVRHYGVLPASPHLFLTDWHKGVYMCQVMPGGQGRGFGEWTVALWFQNDSALTDWCVRCGCTKSLLRYWM